MVTKSDVFKAVRRRRDSRENQERFISLLFECHGIETVALERAGFSRQWLSRHRKDTDFLEAVTAVKEKLEHRYLQVLDSIIVEDRNIPALIFRLKSLRPEAYDEGVRRVTVAKGLEVEDSPPLPTRIILVREPAPFEESGSSPVGEIYKE
jgi:hypothetical protein